MTLRLEIPKLPKGQMEELIHLASNSPRKRHAKILHKHGDYFNHVFNVMMTSSYMRPHHHPGSEKIEQTHLVKGDLKIIFFDRVGDIEQIFLLSEDGRQHISVPAYQNHTYVILSDWVITYETMDGVYEPKTWKSLCDWSPAEDTPGSVGVS